MRGLIVIFAGALLSMAALPADAADSNAIVSAARCATRASADPEPVAALRVIGSQDPVVRSLFGVRDLLIIDAGTSRGVAVNQQYTIRRRDKFVTPRVGLHAVGTAGWLRIVAASENSSIGLVEFSCEGIVTGDYLEPYFEPVLPANLDRPDTSGELDFSTPAKVLFGDRERLTGGIGDYMVIDAGLGRGGEPGARFAIFRNLGNIGVPLTPVGEAIVVYADTDSAVVRVTLSRDAIRRGDLLIPRKSQ